MDEWLVDTLQYNIWQSINTKNMLHANILRQGLELSFNSFVAFSRQFPFS